MIDDKKRVLSTEEQMALMDDAYAALNLLFKDVAVQELKLKKTYYEMLGCFVIDLDVRFAKRGDTNGK